MNCPTCGTPNAEGAPVCANCGANLNAQPQADFNAQQAYQQPNYQQQAPYTQAGFQQPYQQAGYPQQNPYAPNAYQEQVIMQPDGSTVYPMTEQDSMLRLINFILCVISTVSMCWAIIPLAWMIPMTVHSWGIYKGTKANSTAFAVCTLIFVNVIGGILLCVSKKEK